MTDQNRKKKPKRRGRPTKSAAEALTEKINVPVTAATKSDVKELAAADGIDPTTWARIAITRAIAERKPDQ